MNKADKLLYDYYDQMYEAHGRDLAVVRLREVVVKGVSLLVAMPPAKIRGEAGLVISAVKEGKGLLAVEAISASVRDEHKARKEGLVVHFGTGDGDLAFLPDAEVSAEEQSINAWRAFLDRLVPECRTGAESRLGLPGRIPYLDGAWLGDMIFLPDAPPMLPREITEVQGVFSAAAAASNLDHSFAVDGDLCLPRALILSSPPVVSRLGGNLRLADCPAGATPPDVDVPPETLRGWGLSVGRSLVLGQGDGARAFVYTLRKRRGEAVTELVEQAAGGRSIRYSWNGEAWKRFEARLPEEMESAVRSVLARVVLRLRLPAGFLPAAPGPEAAARLAGLLDMLGLGAAGLPEAERRLAEELAGALETIARLADVDDAADMAEIVVRAEPLKRAVDAVSETALDSIRGALPDPLPPVGKAGLEQDLVFLRRLRDGSDAPLLDTLLDTPGKTCIFLNNVFRSPQAKAAAAAVIDPIRRLCAAVAGARDADRLLLSLLKQPGPARVRELRAEHPDKEESLAALRKALASLGHGTPTTVMRALAKAIHGPDSPEIAADRALLRQMLEARTLDAMFASLSGRGRYNLVNFRYALAVSLASFLQGLVRRRGAPLPGQSPGEIVRALHGRLAGVAGLVEPYNAFLAGGGQPGRTRAAGSRSGGPHEPAAA